MSAAPRQSRLWTKPAPQALCRKKYRLCMPRWKRPVTSRTPQPPTLAPPSLPISLAMAPHVSRRLPASACWARANFAKEYATKRYRSNCINWGMLPFLVEDPSVFELGDCIYLPGVRKALLEVADTMPAVAVKPDGSVKEFTVKLGALTDAERQILADGCLINYYKNN